MDISNLDDRDIPTIRTNLISTRKRESFLVVDRVQLDAFFERMTSDSKTLLTWMFVLNVCRTYGDRAVRITPTWTQRFGISRKALKKCLCRLSRSGLLSTTHARGRSPEVTLDDSVSWEVRGMRKRQSHGRNGRR